MRPTRFAKMGSAFSRAFGNATAVFMVDGVVTSPVTLILRNGRSLDLADQNDQDIEARTYSLAVAASDVPGLTSQRDTMVFDGVTYAIRNIEDDARAMLRIYVTGDI